MDQQFEKWFTSMPNYDMIVEGVKRKLKDAFDMGFAYGMDEVTGRIKDSPVISEEAKAALLDDLDK